ncbi:hypothetical protein ABE527_18410 [Brucella sp. TWI432]
MNTSSGDSFFTARNFYDEQARTFNPDSCEQLIEASVRNLSHRCGPIYAATRLQRLADICAGVHVMPIEHWNQKPEPTPAPITTNKTWRGVLIGVLKKPTLNYPFLMGWLLCLLFMSALDLLRLAL